MIKYYKKRQAFVQEYYSRNMSSLSPKISLTPILPGQRVPSLISRDSFPILYQEISKQELDEILVCPYKVGDLVVDVIHHINSYHLHSYFDNAALLQIDSIDDNGILICTSVLTNSFQLLHHTQVCPLTPELERYYSCMMNDLNPFVKGQRVGIGGGRSYDSYVVEKINKKSIHIKGIDSPHPISTFRCIIPGVKYNRPC